jgi:hypothetical protein
VRAKPERPVKPEQIPGISGVTALAGAFKNAEPAGYVPQRA